MGMIQKGKNIVKKGAAKYYDFMYKDENLDKKKDKLNMQAIVEEKKEKKHKVSIKNFISRDKVGEEVNDTREVFFKGEEYYYANIIDINQLRDAEVKKYSKPLMGRDILTRDFKGTPLYIESNENYLRIRDAFRVQKENQDEDERFVYLVTDYEDFVIRFEVEIRF